MLLRRLVEGLAFALAACLGYYQWVHPNRVVERFPWYPLAGPVVVLAGILFFELVAWAVERQYRDRGGKDS